ncbi:hypothetical protein [uncultured Luteimonas sp.]|uniref:hypothetical protein n=1 Tax=uncultured Luteimonas sp. TaxID=453144 RepID=UPI0026112E08|nr:hypothetical protein [uncultured Luteimonas sp.]
MNDPRHDHDLPAALRMQLRTLRTPEPPARELWPDIAARLPSQPRAAAEPAPRRRPRLLPALSAAAVLALALGLGWQLRPSSPEPAQAPPLADRPAPAQAAPLVVVADAMTREYNGALREVPAPRPTAPGYRSLLELDASAAAVRDALAQDPDAVFLLQRLQHIHARRLALTRQLASA